MWVHRSIFCLLLDIFVTIESYEKNNGISFPMQIGKTSELSRRERYAYF